MDTTTIDQALDPPQTEFQAGPPSRPADHARRPAREPGGVRPI